MRVLHRTPGIIWVPVCQEYVDDELEVGLPSDWLAEKDDSCRKKKGKKEIILFLNAVKIYIITCLLNF